MDGHFLVERIARFLFSSLQARRGAEIIGEMGQCIIIG